MSLSSQQSVRLTAGLNGFSGSSGRSDFDSDQLPSASQSLMNLSEIPYEILKFEEGDLIFEKGQTPKGIYVLKSGCVKLFVSRENTRGRTTSPEYVTKLISPGEVFGYKAVVRQIDARAYAKAVKDTVVWLYSKESVLNVIAAAHPLVRTVLEQAIVDIESYEKISQLHYLASVQERIAYQLVMIADRFGIQTPNGISINLKLTRNEFAQLASTINESLSRHLTEFKNDGLIDINGKEIIVKDRVGLAARSGNFK